MLEAQAAGRVDGQLAHRHPPRRLAAEDEGGRLLEALLRRGVRLCAGAESGRQASRPGRRRDDARRARQERHLLHAAPSSSAIPTRRPDEISQTIALGARLKLMGAEMVQFHRLRMWPPAPITTLTPAGRLRPRLAAHRVSVPPGPGRAHRGDPLGQSLLQRLLRPRDHRRHRRPVGAGGDVLPPCGDPGAVHRGRPGPAYPWRPHRRLLRRPGGSGLPEARRASWDPTSAAHKTWLAMRPLFRRRSPMRRLHAETRSLVEGLFGYEEWRVHFVTGVPTPEPAAARRHHLVGLPFAARLGQTAIEACGPAGADHRPARAAHPHPGARSVRQVRLV